MKSESLLGTERGDEAGFHLPAFGVLGKDNQGGAREVRHEQKKGCPEGSLPIPSGDEKAR
jgi:hypothetical protein